MSEETVTVQQQVKIATRVWQWTVLNCTLEHQTLRKSEEKMENLKPKTGHLLDSSVAKK